MKTCLKMFAWGVSFMLLLATGSISSFAQTTYQAETGTVGAGSAVDNTQAGFTGTGYVDFGGNNSFAEWTITAASAGTYSINFVYANGSTVNRQCNMTVDGGAQGSIPFAPGANWTTWIGTSANVTLTAGNHTVRLTATANGGPNLDRLEVTGGDGVPPSVPAGLSASAIGTTSFTLSWSASTDNVGVTGYEVFRNGMSIGTTATTSMSVTGLTCNTSYSMTVRARDAANNTSAASAALPVMTTACAPSASVTIQAEDFTTQSGCAVRSDIAGFTGAGFLDFGGNGTFAEWSVTISAAGPQMITFFYANGSTANRQCALSINGTPNGNVAFAPTGDWTIWNGVSVTVPMSGGNNVIRLTSGTNGGPNLDRLVVTGGELDTTPPSAPTGLSASNISSTGFTLSWNASTDSGSGVASYEVFTGSTSRGTTSNTSMNVSGLSASTTYSVTVRAKDLANNVSSPSAPLSVTTTGTPPGPTGVMTPGANLMNIGWYNGWSDFFASGVNWNTTTNPWNPAFISDLQGASIKCLRFMDWNLVNMSCVITWSQRIPKTANHYNTSNNVPAWIDHWDSNTQTHTLEWNGRTMRGVAIEWQIDLCNRIGADMWVCVPAAADANYQTQLATLIKNNLNPNLKVYVEWANEIWNWGFPSTVYTDQQASSTGVGSINVGGFCDPWRKFYVHSAVRLFDRFNNVFGSSSNRVVKVMCGQVGYKAWPAGAIVNNQTRGDMYALANSTINPNGTMPDVYGVAPYYGSGTLNTGIDAAGLREGVMRVRRGLDEGGGNSIKMVCYEGGSDFYTGNDAADVAKARDSRNQQIYVDYLNALDDVIQGVFNQFSFTGGTWGLKIATGESPSINPKWRGWVQYWNAHPPAARLSFGDESLTVLESTEENGFALYPNPVSGEVKLIGVELPANIQISNLLGQRVKSVVTKDGNVDVSDLSKGIYLFNVKNKVVRMIKE